MIQLMTGLNYAFVKSAMILISVTSLHSVSAQSTPPTPGSCALDLVVGNDQQVNQLQLNSGSGAFGEAVNLPLDPRWSTFALVMGDVDGDGDLDLVVGNANFYNQLLLNDGSGTFSEVVDLPGDIKQTRGLVLADVDGDGDLDLVVGYIYESQNLLLFNNGSGTFDRQVDLPSNIHGVTSIAMGDVNGDGHLDLVTSTHEHGQTNKLQLGNGDGTFLGIVDLPGSQHRANTLAMGDVDNDGDLDMVIGNSREVDQLLLNDGSGTFSEVVDLPGDKKNTYALVMGDVNGDGHLDLVAINWDNDGFNQLLLNNGSGAFNEAVDLPGDINRHANALVMGDVDGDGDLDLVVGNLFSSNQLLLNNGSGAFGEPIDLLAGFNDTLALAMGDVSAGGAHCSAALMAPNPASLTSPPPVSPPPASPPPPMSPLQCGPGTSIDPMTATCTIDCNEGRRAQEATAQPHAGDEHMSNLADLLVEAGKESLDPAAKAEGLRAIDELRQTLDKLRHQLL